MASDRGLVAPGRGAGECVTRPEFVDIAHRGLHQIHDRVERHVGEAADTFGLSQHRHQMIGSNGRRRVIRPPVGVSHREGPTTKGGYQVVHQRIPGGGEPGLITEPNRTPFGIRQGHQRVHRGPSDMRPQHLKAERSRHVGHHGGVNRIDRGRDLANRIVGRCYHNDVDTRTGVRNRIAPAPYMSDIPVGVGQGENE